MAQHISDKVVLNNGVNMPWIGLGVWMMSDGTEVEKAVNSALEVGYLSIDTASIYGNEKGVGNALKEFCDKQRRGLSYLKSLELKSRI